MTIRLWIETTHHAAFRYGGWAHVSQIAGAVSGAAGGERGVTPERIALLALIEGLTGLPPAPLTLHSASPGLIAAARHLIMPPQGEGAPPDDLDLWAQAQTLAAGRVITLKPIHRGPENPVAFLHAWAEVGQDKAKGAGRFTAAIPKPNLAKARLNP